MDAETTLKLLLDKGIISKDQIDSLQENDPVWEELADTLHTILCIKNHRERQDLTLTEHELTHPKEHNLCFYNDPYYDEDRKLWIDKAKKLSDIFNENPESILNTFRHLTNIAKRSKIEDWIIMLIAATESIDDTITTRELLALFDVIPEQASTEQVVAHDQLLD